MNIGGKYRIVSKKIHDKTRATKSFIADGVVIGNEAKQVLCPAVD